ncbi:LysR family transcriptional regulator [Hoeflea sp.]|uniref:LysR family transcriptional regulator n=1 Tax=Hoeflea sp. TaxID=1940281 RepID=UPI00374836F2
MKTPFDLRFLTTFAAVAEHQSFSKAATSLGVAKGTVSRTIAQLEAELGVELLHRTTHHVALSTAGVVLYERTREHLRALQTSVANLPELEEEPSGLLRLTCSPDFGVLVLPAIITGFSRRFPNVRFDIRLSTDHEDLVREGFDLAIRVATGPLKDSALKMRRIGRGTAAFYAAPAYIARCERPQRLLDEQHSWVLHAGVIQLLKLDIDSVQFCVDDFFLARDLMRDGVGVGMLPTFIAQSYLDEGLLEEVSLQGAPEMFGDLVMLYPSSGQTPKKVTAFRDFLIEALKSETQL